MTNKVCMLVSNRGFDDTRVCTEAEALVAAGCDVTVLGWDRRARRDYDLRQNGVNFVCIKVRSTHGRGLIQLLFLVTLWGRALHVLRRLGPDVIHSHDLDTLPLGCLAARTLGAKLVFDAHENFPDMMDGHLPAPAVRMLRWLEAKLVPRTDLLITVGPRLAEHYRRLGAGWVEVVGNFKNAADYAFSAERLAQARRELGVGDGVIAISFIANLGRERRLEPLFAAVAADRRFACVVGGTGSQAELARRWADEHDNIIYLGRVRPGRVPLLTAACDAVYYGFDESNPNARWSAPNKLYEAIAAGRPILAGDFGEVGDTIRKYGCGLITETATAAGLGPALDKLTEPGVLAAMGERARAVQAGYSRDQACRRVVEAYELLLGRQGGSNE